MEAGTFVDIKNKLRHQQIQEIWMLCQYQPSPEKMEALASRYEADDGVFAYAWQERGAYLGLILLQRKDGDAFEIRSIATKTGCQGQGIGTSLLAYAMHQLDCSSFMAETDDDAVGFYQKAGFEVQCLGEKYPGTVRYRCELSAR